MEGIFLLKNRKYMYKNRKYTFKMLILTSLFRHVGMILKIIGEVNIY